MRKKLFSLLLCLVMVLTLIPATVFADEQDGGSDTAITIVDSEGASHAITVSDITAANSVEATGETPWTNTAGAEYVGTFYSFKSILENAGLDASEAHGLKIVATDGFTSGLAAENIDSLYIFDQGLVTKNGAPAGAEGTYGTAINGSAGNLWAKSVATITFADDHVWFVKGGACKHYCAICGEDEPSITLTDGEGTETTIYDCMIKAATSEEATDEEPWTNLKGGSYVGTFYSFKSILETLGVDVSEAHGLKFVATDGFTSGLSADNIDDLYIYDQGQVTKDGVAVGEAGTYGTAINGSAGNLWAKSVASITVSNDHVWFVKGGACKHYCAICGGDEPKLSFELNGHGEAIEPQYACEISITEPAEEGFLFEGWFSDSAFKNAVDFENFEITEDTTIYAKWTEDKFTDVNEGSWYYETVNAAKDRNIMNGYNPGKFGPNDKMTREQYAVAIHRFNGSEETPFEAVYPDVKEGKFYTEAAIWCKKNNIITGYQNGKFGVGDTITREQAVTVLYRYYKDYLGNETDNATELDSFTDADKVSSFAVDGFKWCVEEGIIKGKDNNTKLAPKDLLTRAEAATILVRAYDIIMHQWQ